MILPGYQSSDSASSSKFHHLALLVALVLHSSNFHHWPLFVVLVLPSGWLIGFTFCHPILRSLDWEHFNCNPWLLLSSAVVVNTNQLSVTSSHQTIQYQHLINTLALIKLHPSSYQGQYLHTSIPITSSLLYAYKGFWPLRYGFSQKICLLIFFYEKLYKQM